jgi:ABC-type Fe3+-hydroxamate transport system substrate-binding protein
VRVEEVFRRAARLDGSALSRFRPAWCSALLASAVGIAAGSPIRAAEPARIVSLSPAASEVLIGIGAAHAIVAVDEDSHRLDALGDLPVVDLGRAAGLAPDLVIVPRLDGEARLDWLLRAPGGEIFEFAPHNFDDAFQLCRALGARLGRLEQARSFIRDHSSELARISSGSTGEPRPRVAALIELHPLVVAGGHSFVTDLIEMAGAESVTHESEDVRIPMSVEQLLALRPDLVLVTGSTELSRFERDALRQRLGPEPHIAALTLDLDTLWLHDAVAVVRRLRSLVASTADAKP